jgi:hypothetical protein
MGAVTGVVQESSGLNRMNNSPNFGWFWHAIVVGAMLSQPEREDRASRSISMKIALASS